MRVFLYSSSSSSLKITFCSLCVSICWCSIQLSLDSDIFDNRRTLKFVENGTVYTRLSRSEHKIFLKRVMYMKYASKRPLFFVKCDTSISFSRLVYSQRGNYFSKELFQKFLFNFFFNCTIFSFKDVYSTGTTHSDI